MTEDAKKAWIDRIVSKSKDAIVLITLVSMIFSAIIMITRPYWEPFQSLPEKVDLLLAQNAGKAPRILDFQGNALVLNEGSTLEANDDLEVIYSLRRNIPCDTIVYPEFHNVDTGFVKVGPSLSAQKAPVTRDFNPFRLSVQLPDDIQPGRYIYYPRVSPQDCGVYEEMRVTPSQVFTVLPDTRL